MFYRISDLANAETGAAGGIGIGESSGPKGRSRMHVRLPFRSPKWGDLGKLPGPGRLQVQGSDAMRAQ